jgi:hypothetical protein
MKMCISKPDTIKKAQNGESHKEAAEKGRK